MTGFQLHPRYPVQKQASRPWPVAVSIGRTGACQCGGQKDDKWAPAKRVFTEQDYMATKQSQERSLWAEQLRKATGSRHHLFWEPVLDPPALLSQVTVVLMSPRRPVSVGTVARSCSCFEVDDIRIVAPRCEHISRHSKSASKGAQYLLYRAKSAATIQEATTDCHLRVAFTRWVQGCPLPYYDLASLTSHPLIQQLITAPVPTEAANAHVQHPADSTMVSSSSAELSQSGSVASDLGMKLQTPRIALVFGREDLGMSDEDVSACDVVCTIPIGRLQESLSLSHAVSLALSGIFQQRLAHISHLAAGQAGAVAAYNVSSPAGLAAGYDNSVGQER